MTNPIKFMRCWLIRHNWNYAVISDKNDKLIQGSRLYYKKFNTKYCKRCNKRVIMSTELVETEE